MATRTTTPNPPTMPARNPRDRRDEEDRRAEERAAAERRDARKGQPEDETGPDTSHEGDILGISGATRPIPQATKKKGGNPKGIEIGKSDTPGAGDVEQSPGATSIDMGAGGEGHKVDRDT